VEFHRNQRKNLKPEQLAEDLSRLSLPRSLEACFSFYYTSHGEKRERWLNLMENSFILEEAQRRP
jgi:hypothetical protein